MHLCAAPLVLALALAAGCGEEPLIVLHVDARTDLTPGVDFASARVLVTRTGSDFVSTGETPADTGADWVTGARVASLPITTAGTYLVEVVLARPDGTDLISRRVRVAVMATTGVVVVLSRDCIGVVCPGAGDPSTHTECFGGRCVTPDCVPDDLLSCGLCETVADCPPPASCADVACVDQLCQVTAHDERCASGQICDGTVGCRRCSWDPIAGGDHCGDDWTPPDGSEIAGVHVDVGRFTVATGTTVRVAGVMGEARGSVSVAAETIAIDGQLDASGAGYIGGGGGDGASSTASCGVDGSGGSGGSGPFAGSAGGGGPGFARITMADPCMDGAGVVLPTAGGGGNGGYSVAAGNDDTSLDDTLFIGSGGGGAGGGGAGADRGHNSAYPAGTGGGGGAGGRGGGSVALLARTAIGIGGEVLTRGLRGGGNGGNAQMLTEPCDRDDPAAGGVGGNPAASGSGAGGSYSCQTARCTTSGDKGSTDTCGGLGGQGGAGAGGGVLLSSPSVIVGGRVDASGGAAVDNGGTIKIRACTHTPGEYVSPRIAELAREGC